MDIVVIFDKRLDPNSVSTASVQVAGFREGQPVKDAVTAVSVTYDDSNRSAKLSGHFQARLRYVVTVRGNAPNQIIDVDGLALDGDADPMHTAGGNFTSWFETFTPVG
jgi:hypothetical protein